MSVESSDVWGSTPSVGIVMTVESSAPTLSGVNPPLSSVSARTPTEVGLAQDQAPISWRPEDIQHMIAVAVQQSLSGHGFPANRPTAVQSVPVDPKDSPDRFNMDDVSLAPLRFLHHLPQTGGTSRCHLI